MLFNLLVGQIPEAIFFSLFMLYTKQLKEKRLLYILLMVIEYALLIQVFPYNVLFQILYTFISYLILKILYKEKAQLTDIYTFSIASLLLIITSAINYFIIRFTIKDLNICVVIHKIILFIILFLIKNKLPNIQKMYKRLWNRKFNNKTKIKSTTFRAINVVIFNIMFYLINFGMLYIIIQNGGV